MSPIDAYVSQARKLPRITREEETALAKKYHRGDKRAGQKLIEAHLLFAIREANKWHRRWGVPLEDLVQAANEGMMHALRLYDPKRGVRFLSYASYYTRVWLDRYVMRNAGMINYGTTVARRRLFFMAKAVVNELKQRHQDTELTELIVLAAEDLGAKVGDVEAAYHHGPDLSLNEPLDGGDKEHQDMVADGEASAAELLAEKELREIVRKAVRQSVRNGKEWVIAEQRLLAEEPMTLEQIGERVGVSRERVRQIEQGVLTRTKAALTGVR